MQSERGPMTREQEIACNKRIDRRGPEPLCSFTLVRESYGILVGIVGYCTVHDGGQIAVNSAVQNWTEVPSASGCRDSDRKLEKRR